MFIDQRKDQDERLILRNHRRTTTIHVHRIHQHRATKGSPYRQEEKLPRASGRQPKEIKKEALEAAIKQEIRGVPKKQHRDLGKEPRG